MTELIKDFEIKDATMLLALTQYVMDPANLFFFLVGRHSYKTQI